MKKFLTLFSILIIAMNSCNSPEKEPFLIKTYIINPDYSGIYDNDDFDENLIITVYKDQNGNFFKKNGNYLTYCDSVWERTIYIKNDTIYKK